MSVEIHVDGFDGRPLPTGSLVTGRVRVKLKKPEQLHAVTQVLFAFYGRSSVHITRQKLETYTKYSSRDNRFELQGLGGSQPRASQRSEWRTYTYESQCLLFTQRHILGQSGFQMPVPGDDCALEFPFEFRIPTHSEPQPPESIEGHACECFAASGAFPGSLGYDPPHKVPRPQPLPDTVHGFDDDLIENTRGTASIRYALHAVVPELGGSDRWFFGSSGPPESTVDIPIYNPVSMPPRPIPYKVLGHQDEIRTMRLLENHQDKKLSFRDSMRSVFKKDRLPWIAFGIVFQAPELLWLDQPPDTKLPFSIGVRRLASGIGDATAPPPMPIPGVSCDDKGRPIGPAAPAANSSDNVPTPQVFLKSLKLKLVAHTALRGGNDRFSGFGPKRFEGLTPVTFFKFKASSSSPQLELPVGEEAWTNLGHALGASLGELRAAASEAGIGGITGEFLTPNFWRRWGIEWDLRLECAEEEIHWQSEAHYGGGLGLQFWRGDGAPAGPPIQPVPSPQPK